MIQTRHRVFTLLYLTIILFASFPLNQAQRLIGTSGNDCVDSLRAGVQKFWCSQSKCNVNLCDTTYQNWLYTSLLTACANQWPNDNVPTYSKNTCAGGSTLTTSHASSTTSNPSGGGHKGEARPTAAHTSIVVLAGSVMLALSVGFFVALPAP